MKNLLRNLKAEIDYHKEMLDKYFKNGQFLKVSEEAGVLANLSYAYNLVDENRDQMGYERKYLRLIYRDSNGNLCDFTKPMESWIYEWAYDSKYLPLDNEVILVAEINGETILDKIISENTAFVRFHEIAAYLKWPKIKQTFESLADPEKEEKQQFREWLERQVGILW